MIFLKASFHLLWPLDLLSRIYIGTTQENEIFLPGWQCFRFFINSHFQIYSILKNRYYLACFIHQGRL